MIHCPTCNHDLLELHGTVEDENDNIMGWGCTQCRDCVVLDDCERNGE